MVLTAALLVVLPVRAAPEPVASQRLVEAEVVVSDDPTEPPSSAAWRPVRLGAPPPAADASGRYAWYRLRFEADGRAAGEPPAIYTSRVSRDALLFLNGARVGGVQAQGVARRLLCCAFFAELPAQQVVEGSNALAIRLSTHHLAFGWQMPDLPPVYLGQASTLWAQYEQRLLLDSIGVFVALLLSFTIGGYGLLLWLRRRGETMLLHFAMAALSLGAVLSIDMWFVEHWSRLLTVLVALFDASCAVFLLVFLLRYAGWRWPKAEAGAWAWVALSTLIACFWDYFDPLSPARPWLYTAVVAYMLPVPLTAAIAWRRRDVHSMLLFAAAAVSAGLVGWQELVVYDDPERIHLWAFHLVGFIAVIGWILVDRYARSLSEAERLNAELEARVAQKHAELQQQFARSRELERAQAVVQERARLMSDMHDGIGGQLIATLGLVEHGEAARDDIATALRECIDDLRLAIDSLEPSQDELLPVLGNLRYRLEPRLRQQGIELDWAVQDVPRLACLTPQNVLHVLRILQEAFTNVLKHAGARRVRVVTRVDGERVAIEVSDDGKGFSETGAPRGHGLANMRRRAQAVGGELRLHPSAMGTTLSLLLPVS